METSGWTIHSSVGLQGASHERGRAASWGTERSALLRDQDSAGEEPPYPLTPQKTYLGDASFVPYPRQLCPDPALRRPRPFSTAPSPR